MTGAVFSGKILATFETLNSILGIPYVPETKNASVLMGNVCEQRLFVGDGRLEGEILEEL